MGLAVALGEMDTVEIGFKQALSFVTQQGEIIDAGVGSGRRLRVGGGVGMMFGDENCGGGVLQELAFVPDFGFAEIEGVVTQFDGLMAQKRRDLVAIADQFDGSCFIDLAFGAMAEGLVKDVGVDGASAAVRVCW